MADIQFLRLNGHWALACDRLQWVVQHRRGKPGREQWRPVSFVATDRRVLLRVLRENGVEFTPEARTALESLPDTFRGFLAVFHEGPLAEQTGVPERDDALPGVWGSSQPLARLWYAFVGSELMPVVINPDHEVLSGATKAMATLT